VWGGDETGRDVTQSKLVSGEERRPFVWAGLSSVESDFRSRPAAPARTCPLLPCSPVPLPPRILVRQSEPPKLDSFSKSKQPARFSFSPSSPALSHRLGVRARVRAPLFDGERGGVERDRDGEGERGSGRASERERQVSEARRSPRRGK
jgi:hypothetical protein